VLGGFLFDIGYQGTEKQEKIIKKRQWENKTPLQISSTQKVYSTSYTSKIKRKVGQNLTETSTSTIDQCLCLAAEKKSEKISGVRTHKATHDLIR